MQNTPRILMWASGVVEHPANEAVGCTPDQYCDDVSKLTRRTVLAKVRQHGPAASHV